MTKIEWVRGEDGSDGISWNALRAVRALSINGETKTFSAHHCEHVNQACVNCYAERTNPRLGGLPFKPGHRKDYSFQIDRGKLEMPLRRRKPTRWFVESMSDTFGEWWPRDLVDQLYAVMGACPEQTFINLTKRPERRREYLDDPSLHERLVHVAGHVGLSPEICYARFPLPNVIEGVSVSCQEEADAFVPILLQTRCAVRCVSAEPLLGPITFWGYNGEGLLRWPGVVVSGGMMASTPDHPPEGYDDSYPGIDWIIVGGESGPRARPMDPEWARSIRDQCQAAEVAYFHKQNGEFVTEWRELGDPQWTVRRVGKAAAGRLLDGRTWDEFPAMPGRARQEPARQPLPFWYGQR